MRHTRTTQQATHKPQAAHRAPYATRKQKPHTPSNNRKIASGTTILGRASLDATHRQSTVRSADGASASVAATAPAADVAAETNVVATAQRTANATPSSQHRPNSANGDEKMPLSRKPPLCTSGERAERRKRSAKYKKKQVQ